MGSEQFKVLNMCRNTKFNPIGMVNLVSIDGDLLQIYVLTCTDASQGKPCAGAFEEDGLKGNTVTRAASRNIGKSSSCVGVPAVIPPHLVSQPRVLKSRKS